MRTEEEIIKKVLEVAKKDDEVRAVVRTDLKPVQEFLHKYAFSFIVKDSEKYEDDIFSECFGKRILLYRGDKNYPEMFPDTKAFLMVYEDGITLVIDILDKDTFFSKYNGEQNYENVWMGDTYQVILDKDNMLPAIERLEETQTLFADKPSEEEYIGTSNEFWWVMKTFAEYTLREELPSAMFYLNVAVRDLLNRAIRWRIYLHSGQAVDMGILDGKMEKLLGDELFSIYRKTYPNADYKQIWEAFDAVAELWHKIGCDIAKACGFDYPLEVEKDMLRFIRKLKDSKRLGLRN